MSAGSSAHRPGAVILAGGLARRMGGRDKGLVTLAGREMVAHVLLAIRPAVQDIVINANRNIAAYRRFGVPVVSDAQPEHPGPLAGLSSGIVALGAPTVFMCPCDSPFVTARLVHALADGLAAAPPGTRVACAHDGERLQPVFAVVDASTRSALDAFLESGERKIDRWYAEVGMAVVDCSAERAAFRNINTDEELARAEAELDGAAPT